MARSLNHPIPSRALHIALIIPAFLLFSITWYETAALAVMILLFDIYLLPDLAVISTQNEATASLRTSRTDMILYPVAVLALALIFNHYLEIVAMAWALLALGDGMAGAVGAIWGRHPLPFNCQKTWEGFATFIVFGGAGALVLKLWMSDLPLTRKGLLICIAAALVGAFVESLPIRLSDNITVPLICGGFIFCAGLVERSALDRNLPYLGVRIVLAVVINLAFALITLGLGQITASGAALGFALGVAVYMGFGYKSFLILLSFFVLGVVATRLGYARKLERGIAERRRGARTWREAAGNILPAAFFSVLVITTPYQWAFLMALVASLAEAAGDTVASEMGKWLSARAYLITTLEPVKAGEDGGISVAGTAAGFGASVLVVLLGCELGLCWGWNAVIVLAAAFVGNLADSLIGATLERRGLVTNSIVNFIGTSLAGALALVIALH
ncbi:MAG TPA: DUF92 domain-containing protein [Terriglobia bacterium]|nr:DUF92 domain-containing protein [Terriglobia bacterium]